jgi:hypothetical protein
MRDRQDGCKSRLPGAIAQVSALYVVVFSTSAEAKEAVINVGRVLRNEYVIGYRPPDSGTSGRWHRIRVKTKANVNVHARDSYYLR